MHFYFKDVNDAFYNLVRRFKTSGDRIIKTDSRNGPVMMIDEPVIITYSDPTSRVLLNKGRDANPFFHVYEALWMLAGRNDLAPLTYYVKNMANYSDDGKTLNGAYGYRWRHATKLVEAGHAGFMNCGFKHYSIEKDWGHNQLDIIIKHLKVQPNSRRAVLQMWNVEDDLLKIGQSLGGGCPTLGNVSKDVCCNLSVMFSIRPCTECDGKGIYRGRYTPDDPTSPYVEEPCENHESFLDMTVTNRSNDMIWGMLGANYVHFTFLQEYMAAKIGVEVGRYHHITNNLHVYENNFKPDEWLVGPYTGVKEGKRTPLLQPESVDDLSHKLFDKEVNAFVSDNKDGNTVTAQTTWQVPFLRDVAQPMCHAYHMYKQKDMDAVRHWLSCIEDDNWRAACMTWIDNRLLSKEKR